MTFRNYAEKPYEFVLIAKLIGYKSLRDFLIANATKGIEVEKRLGVGWYQSVTIPKEVLLAEGLWKEGEVLPFDKTATYAAVSWPNGVEAYFKSLYLTRLKLTETVIDRLDIDFDDEDILD
jgi:hypothetical protein